MDTKDKLAEEFPELVKIIDRWPDQAGKGAVWQIARLAYDFGFGRGMTHGLKQGDKIMGWALEQLGQAHDKAGDKVQPPR